MKTGFLSLGMACSLAVLLAACSDNKAALPAPATAASAPAAALPAVTVSLVKAQKRDLAVELKATGTVTPLTSVDVRAQVTSTISKVHIREGQFVKAGELLFTLDSRTDEANAAKARAQLAKDQATLADAQRQFVRAQQLFSQNFISQGAVDTAQALVEATTATIASDQAAIDAAKVAVSYARVLAPNSGRAGAINVSAGSAIQANQTTLVTITQLDPMGVAFSIPQRNLPDALAALKDGGASVSATLADGGGSFKGRLQFVDNAIDASSGAVKVKAEFANKDNKLWPGAFVEVSQTVSTLKDTVVVPLAAIVQTARASIVFVMEDGKAAVRPIKLLYAQGNDAAVSGVKEGELVVLDGKQNVRPNTPLVERAKEPKSAASGPARADGPAASVAANPGKAATP